MLGVTAGGGGGGRGPCAPRLNPPLLLMLRVHNCGVGNSTPQRSFRIHNFDGAILLKVELSCLSFKDSVTTHFEKFTLFFFEKKFRSALNLKFWTSLTHCNNPLWKELRTLNKKFKVR